MSGMEMPPRPSKKMGRPGKLTKALIEKIVSAIRIGNYMETAAAYAGVDKTTLHGWLKKGNAARSGIYRDLIVAVEEALAEAEVRDVANISRAAGSGTWQASAWRLERKFPDRWGRTDRSKLEVTGADGGALKVEGNFADLLAAAKRRDDDED